MDKKLVFTALLAASVIAGHRPGDALAADALNEPQIIERTIKIEGTVEKPRVLFIVPRAKVWKEYSVKKSFSAEILKPVYPEALMKGFIESGIENDNRR